MQIQISEYNLEVRPVRADENEAILEVYRECEDFLALGPVATASMEMVKGDLALSAGHGGIYCGIYNGGGRMIGVVDYIPAVFEGNACLAELSLLMIAAPCRSGGIGRAVFEAWEREIRKDKSLTGILAGVQVNNPSAIRFWKRMGFRITGGPTLMRDGTTVFGLRKDF